MPELSKKELCTGCTACASVCPKGCISMQPDKNGFVYPVIDTHKCIGCGLCEKVCPVLQPLKVAMDLPRSYAAYSTDKEARLNSSSGGIFTEIAKTVLKNGGVVFGAAYNERFEVIYICVENESDLAKLRGAKYAQSDLCGIFVTVKECLEQGKKVLFSGTPCQVGGLKAYLRREYENLLTVDFVCHSVPSPMAWKAYVNYRAWQDNGGELPSRINLRSKVTGWSRYQYSNRFEYGDGSVHNCKSGESLYMKLFVGGYINRESCANCQFKGYSRISDLTIGDFWGIWDIAPDMDDDCGTSVVLCQSHRGATLLETISNRVVMKQVTLEEASRNNTAMLQSCIHDPRRQKALDAIKIGDISECEKLFVHKKRILTRILNNVKRRFFVKRG